MLPCTSCIVLLQMLQQLIEQKLHQMGCALCKIVILSEQQLNDLILKAEVLSRLHLFKILNFYLAYPVIAVHQLEKIVGAVSGCAFSLLFQYDRGKGS